MKLVVVGATGLVGKVMLDVLSELKFKFDTLYLAASSKSVGKVITYNGNDYSVISVEQAIELKPDIAIFSAGGSTSLIYAPKFAEVGTFVIDNSSAWRMDRTKKLIVPEINALELTENDKIIANPNCSTIQMVMALAPLHKKYRIKRIVVSTYQSVTGSGLVAVNQLNNERSNNFNGEKKYPHVIDLNCIPQCDDFSDDDYTKEELKLINETKKILNDYSIRITATAVRVPVMGGHSESVNIEFDNKFEINNIKQLLSETSGIIVEDEPAKGLYPMPRHANGKNEVFVGRIRRDLSQANSLNMWIVADNLRKGAATNAIQIAQYLVDNKLVK